GTRHLDATERHEGMVAAIAFESVVKLLAFLVVGIFVTFGIYEGFADLFGVVAEWPKLEALGNVAPDGDYATWSILIFISMFTMGALPGQFQVAVVENVDEDPLRRAIWLFPLYLLLINIFVLPVAVGGLVAFAGRGVDADTFVLTLPMAYQK